MLDMSTYDAMSEHQQKLVQHISNAARLTMRVAGYQPRNDDHAARFDEACAVYLNASLRALGEGVTPGQDRASSHPAFASGPLGSKGG